MAPLGPTQQQKLVASDAASGDELGYSVSLSGDTVVAGAMHKSSSQGAAYVFVRSGTAWTQQQELLASDGVANDWFGMSASLSGETAIVGAIENYGSAPGAAYIFVRSGTSWTQQQKLTASDSVANGYFGYSVALSGNVAVVTAENISFSKGGAVYVFARSGATWTQQQKLLASDGMAGDSFGASLAISGSTAFVGSSSKNSYQGAAYVFGQ